MPEVITLGHVLIVLALLAVLAAIFSAVTALRHRGFGRGTPQYAEARLARRHALYAIIAVLIFGAGWLTPLCDIALVGGAA